MEYSLQASLEVFVFPRSCTKAKVLILIDKTMDIIDKSCITVHKLHGQAV